MNDDHETDPLPSFGSVGFDDWWKGQGLDGGSPGMLSSGQPSDLEQSPYVSFSLVTGSSAYMQGMHSAPFAPIAPHPRGLIQGLELRGRPMKTPLDPTNPDLPSRGPQPARRPPPGRKVDSHGVPRASAAITLEKSVKRTKPNRPEACACHARRLM
jgi:hypothetical protein